MKYLVSIEDTAYFAWQIEILIKSFRLLDLEKELIVAIATNKHDKKRSLGIELLSHKNVFWHRNILFNPYLNKINSIILATNNNLLPKNFSVIEPDMVLVKPIETSKKNIALSYDPNYARDRIEKHCPDAKRVIDNQNKNLKNFPALGGIYQFNNVPIDFFQRVLQIAGEIKAEENNCSRRYAEKAAWGIAFCEAFSSFTFEIKKYESSLIEHDLDGNFIHYAHGIPNLFTKHTFRYDGQQISFTDKHPYEALMENNISHVTNYLQKVI